MGHTHDPYPRFSTECFSDTLRIIRSRAVRDELALFLKCVYTLLGAALGATVGEPPGPMASQLDSALNECTLDELIELRSSMIALQEDGFETFGASETAIDPATLAIIMQLVMALINKWINKKQTA
jgi:hypothetical protein